MTVPEPVPDLALSGRPRLAILLPYVSTAGGGVTEAVRLLTAGLAALGRYRIEVISFATDPADPAPDLAARADWPGAEAGVSFHHFPAKGPRNYSFAPGMARHMLASRYDVIHVHGIWMFHVFAALLAARRGTPLLISPHGMLEPWILARTRRLKQAVSLLYQRAALRRARLVHALTVKEQADIAAYQPAARVGIVPNFVPAVPDPGRPPAWLEPGDAGRKIFLFLGRIHDKKGWRALVEAWEDLSDADPAFRDGALLVFCGWIDGVADFESRIARAAARCGNLRYAGPQYGPDKAASYLAADVFLLPSQSEGLPMVILEAVRGEALVAMSRECNLPDFFPDCAIETGHQAAPIRAALTRTFHMPEAEAAAMRNAARDRVERLHSEAGVVGRFSELYQEEIRDE